MIIEFRKIITSLGKQMAAGTNRSDPQIEPRWNFMITPHENIRDKSLQYGRKQKGSY